MQLFITINSQFRLDFHSQNGIHGAIHPIRILINDSHSFLTSPLSIVFFLSFSRITIADPGDRADISPLQSYKAPEQLLGHDFDTAADVWALGVIIYELCTHVYPFQGGSESIVKENILHKDPAPISIATEGDKSLLLFS